MISWETRSEHLHTFSTSDGTLRRGSFVSPDFVSPDFGERCSYADSSQRFSRSYFAGGHPEIYPRFAKLHLQFKFPALDLKTSLELHDKAHIRELVTAYRTDIERTIAAVEQMLEGDTRYFREDFERVRRRLSFSRQAREQLDSLLEQYENQKYVLIQSTQRKVIGVKEISAHATITKEERILIRSHIRELAEMLPNLTPPFLPKEYYAGLLRAF